MRVISLIVILFFLGIKPSSAQLLKLYNAFNFQKIISVPEGSYLILGSLLTEPPNGTTNILLVNLDNAYKINWAKIYLASSINKPYDLIKTQNDELLITGYIQESDLQKDVFLLKLDVQGDIKWGKRYTLGEGIKSTALRIFKHNQGYFLFGNACQSDSCSTFILNLDEVGDVVWGRLYKSSYKINILSDVEPLAGGLYLLGGRAVSSKGFDFWLMKVNHEGQILWSNLYGGNKTDLLYDILATPEGYFMVGETESLTQGPGKALLLSVSEEGLPREGLVFGKEGLTRAQKIFSYQGERIILGETGTEKRSIFRLILAGSEVLETGLLSTDDHVSLSNALQTQETLVVGQSGSQALLASFAETPEETCSSFSEVLFESQQVSFTKQELSLSIVDLQVQGADEAFQAQSFALTERNFCASGESILGDVSHDASLSIVDALLVARCALSLDSRCQPEEADVNCDQKINILDALLIARKSLNLAAPFGCSK